MESFQQQNEYSTATIVSAICASGASSAIPLAPTIAIAPGVHMPVVALGTGEYQGDAAFAAVVSAIKMGYRAIDTAHEYGNQAAIGAAINQLLANQTHAGNGVQGGLQRADLFVITKVEGGLSGAETTSRLHQNVQQLNLAGPLDLVLLHYPKAAPFRTLAETLQEQWLAEASK